MLVIPWATYTSPELAHLGILPEEAERWEEEIDTIDTVTIPLAEVVRKAADQRRRRKLTPLAKSAFRTFFQILQ